MNVCIHLSVNTTVKYVSVPVLSATCFGHLYPSSDRFYIIIHGKEYQGGSLTLF